MEQQLKKIHTLILMLFFPAGKYLYRLKQIDFNGSFEYSNIVEIEVIAPDKYELNQNFPNPFNPATKISFQIPGQYFVSLKYIISGGRSCNTG